MTLKVFATQCWVEVKENEDVNPNPAPLLRASGSNDHRVSAFQETNGFYCETSVRDRDRDRTLNLSAETQLRNEKQDTCRECHDSVATRVLIPRTDPLEKNRRSIQIHRTDNGEIRHGESESTVAYHFVFLDQFEPLAIIARERPKF